MRLPAGHAKRLFLGFTCSIMFLIVFALLIAYNTEAESSSFVKSSFEDYPFTINIPTAQPELTIAFYRQLGFRTSDGLSSGLDVFSMEKEGTPYKLEIIYKRSPHRDSANNSVPGMSLKVESLTKSISELEAKGFHFVEKNGTMDGVNYASLVDPNGISVKLFQP
ncbi:MAG: VOC family protein [Desulfomonilaceae bacterium]